MRANDLDKMTMTRLLRDLAAAHGKPFGALLEAQVDVYHEALRDCAIEEVEQAVKTACRDFDRFPKPKHLRGIVMGRRPARRMHPSSDPGDTCPGCGTAYQWRRLPHWAKGSGPDTHAASLECDCVWRMMVKAYATADDLAEMGPQDPFAAAELRRRAYVHREAA